MMPRARIAAEQALTLDKSLAEAHASLTLVKSVLQWGRRKPKVNFNAPLLSTPTMEIVKRDEKPWPTIQGIEFRSITVVAHKGKQGPCWE